MDAEVHAATYLLETFSRFTRRIKTQANPDLAFMRRVYLNARRIAQEYGIDTRHVDKQMEMVARRKDKLWSIII